MSLVLIRDGNGTVYNEVSKPAVVFDGELGVIYRIGEYDVMKEYYEKVVSVYNYHGFYNMSQEMVLLELPKEQEVVDSVFQNTGYIKTYYEKILNGMESKENQSSNI